MSLPIPAIPSCDHWDTSEEKNIDKVLGCGKHHEVLVSAKGITNKVIGPYWWSKKMRVQY